MEKLLTSKEYHKEWRLTPNGIDCEKRHKEYMKKYHQIPEIKEKWNIYMRNYRKNNPISRSLDFDLQDAMNDVRKRDKNTCQWFNCGLTYKESSIHVHHIFPRNEYPELILVEQYMICYCSNHHELFHKYRGDQYANFISKRWSK